jgi:hypothetical protein
VRIVLKGFDFLETDAGVFSASFLSLAIVIAIEWR